MDSSNLEQFLILAKNANVKTLETLVSQVLNNASVFMFSELLDLPNIKELKKSSPLFFNSLELFSFGNYIAYKENKKQHIELNPQQIKKLKMLTLVDLGSATKTLNYDSLLQDLDLANVRELEDLILEGIYNGLMNGQLDQKKRQFYVESVFGRDLHPTEVDDMLRKLEELYTVVENAEKELEFQMAETNKSVKDDVERKQSLDKKISEKREKISKEGSPSQMMKGFGMGMGGGINAHDIGRYNHRGMEEQKMFSGLKQGFFGRR